MLNGPTGSTRVVGVIGDPVEHSLSPAIHNAAFRSLDLDWIYVAFHVGRGEGASAVDAMRSLRLAGLSVTMPHKAAVVSRVDSLTPAAERLGVANTLSWSASPYGDELVGDSTDGTGFITALRDDDGFDPGGQACLVLGSGGAARALSLALGQAGAKSVTIAGRSIEGAEACAALAGPAGAAVSVEAGSLGAAVAGATLVVNATPVGMAPGDGLPFGLDPDSLSSTHCVVDLIYTPATTTFLAEARKRNATCSNGLGMLIHQAACQFETWTGRPAPLEVMSAAAVGGLARRGA